jgi:hypothetical protein
MPSVREQVPAAIALRLETVAGLTVRRNEALPEKIPTGGLAILRDGDPDVAPSPLTYLWRHAAPVEIVVQHGDAVERDRLSDDLVQAATVALLTDRNLGGLADWLEASPPSADLLPVEGAAAIRAATLIVTIHYATT